MAICVAQTKSDAQIMVEKHKSNVVVDCWNAIRCMDQHIPLPTSFNSYPDLELHHSGKRLEAERSWLRSHHPFPSHVRSRTPRNIVRGRVYKQSIVDADRMVSIDSFNNPHLAVQINRDQ